MMKAEKILRRICPNASGYPEIVSRFVGEVIDAYNDERALESKNTEMPSRYVGIGEEVIIRGKRYRCIEADSVTVACDACAGCDVRREYLNCNDLMCSPFDRKDKKFVWYKQI